MMKKRKHGFLAVMLTLSILVGIVPMYVDADNTAMISSQEAVPEIGSNMNLLPENTTYFKNIHSSIAFDSTAYTRYVVLPDNLFRAELKEDTWAFSTTINFSKVASEGPSVSIVKGTYEGKETRVRFEIKDNSYVLYRASGNPDVYGTQMQSGTTEVALEANKDYQLTMKVSDRELLQCWLDDKLIVEISLKEKGFTDVKPCFGWYCNGSEGKFNNPQFWEEPKIVEPEEPEIVIPEMGSNMNLLPENTTYFKNIHSSIAFDSTAYTRYVVLPDNLFRAELKEDTWAFSTTINFSKVASEGPSVSIVKGTYEGKETRVRFEIKDNSYVLYRASGNPDVYGTQMQSGTTGVALEANKDYQLTMKVSDRELLQCWLDDQLIAEIALKGRGFTNVMPCFGWYCSGSEGKFNTPQFWQESGIKVPEMGSNINVLPDATGSYPTFQSNIAFGSASVVLPDSYYKTELKEDSWAFSTTINFSTLGSEGPAISIVKGTYNGTADCRVRLELRKGSYILYRATGQPYEYGTQMQSGTTGVTLEANKDYQLTMKVSDRELLQCWLDDTLIVEISLKEQGFTGVIPCFGWRGSANAGTGNFKNNQFWEDVQDGPVISQYYDVISGYRTNNEYIAPIRTGYVFAGWFTDEACTDPIAESTTSGEAYAKFVPEKVLRVKYQVKENGEKANLRLVTTVDSLKYQEVGFKIAIGNRTTTRTSTTVYKQIISTENGEVCYNDPQVFSSASEWFHTFSITNVPEGTEFTVVACWKTLDGTQVTGKTRIFTVSKDIATVQGQ